MPVRTVRLVIAAVWTVVVLAGLFLPGRLFPDFSPGVSFLVHVALFAGLTGLWGWVVPRLVMLVVVIAVFVAVGAEGIQLDIVPGRGIQTLDLWADFVGIAAGWLAVGLWKRHRSRLPRYAAPRYRRRPAPTATPRNGSVQTPRDVGSSVHA